MLIQCWCCAVACELMVQHVRTKLASRGVAFKDEGTHLLRTLVESPAAGNQFVCLLPPPFQSTLHYGCCLLQRAVAITLAICPRKSQYWKPPPVCGKLV